MDGGADASQKAEASTRPLGMPDILDIWGSGPSDVWASGYSGTVLHWDGAVLRRLTANAPGTLLAVWGDGAGQLWTVEEEWPDGGRVRQLLRGDGSTFGQVDGGAPSGELPRAFWGTGADDLWLVGRMGEDAADSYGIARHFDGSTWSLAGSGLGSRLNAAWGTRKEMFFVGSSMVGYVAHWVNGTWVTEAYPDPDLIGVWGSSPSDVWAVGAPDAIVHYQGGDWTPVTSGTNDASTVFQAIWGSAANDIWAVGYRGYAGTLASGVIVHWDGSQWSVSPDSPPELLYAVWGSSADDVWAGGTGVILHRQGGAWSRISAGDIY